MAPSLRAEAQCIETPLNKKTLKHGAEKVGGKIGDSPFFKVKVKKTKVHMKPLEKGAKKLKTVNFKKVRGMHVDERANTVALEVERKKNNSVCLAMKFRDTAERKEFQDLATRNNPQMRISAEDYDEKIDVLTQDKVSEAYECEPTIKSQHRPPSKLSTPPNEDYSSRGRSQRPSSRRRAGSICSHCHQVINYGLKSSGLEYDPHSESSNRSMSRGKMASSCVFYLGPNGTAARVYRPRNRRSPLSSQESSELDINDDKFYESTSDTSTTTAQKNGGREKAIVTAASVTPKPTRRSQRLNRDRNSRFNNRNRRSNDNKGSVVYLIWDSSEEDEEEGYYEENEKYTESSSDYIDSLYSSASEYSARPRGVGTSLRELHKPRDVRLR